MCLVIRWDKVADFNDFCRKYSLKHEDVLYIGDDIPDMEVLSMCGIGVSPADGVAEIQEIADYVSPYPGGRGCVRDAVEKVLKARGDWAFDVARYKAKFMLKPVIQWLIIRLWERLDAPAAPPVTIYTMKCCFAGQMLIRRLLLL